MSLGRAISGSPDGVVGSQPDPVGDRPVLLHLDREGSLSAEGLVRGHGS